MNFENLLEESLGGLGIYAIVRTSMMAVEAGTATEAQKNLVDSLIKVLSEYKDKALLQKMKAEAADIEERQRKFEAKWGILPPRS
jgi:hypothetical protein